MSFTSVDAIEFRGKKRFTFTAPTVAAFDQNPVTLLDLSQTGAQIAHRNRFIVGAIAFLQIEVPNKDQKVSLRSEVVWARQEQGQWLTGLRIIEERTDLAADLLEYLLHLRRVRYDRASLERKGNATTKISEQSKGTAATLEEIDETKPVMKAKEYLEKHPSVARRWRNIVLETTSEEQRANHSIEVLTVWELLNRSVRIEVVEFVFQVL